jgi:hypothetical protein
VFGLKHFSIICFSRSIVASCVVLFLCYVNAWLKLRERIPGLHLSWQGTLYILGVGAIANAIPDYLSLLKTRYLIGKLSSVSQAFWILILAVDLGIDVLFAYVSLVLAAIVAVFYTNGLSPEATSNLMPWWISQLVHFRAPPEFTFWFYPAFFTSVWLWLYAGSGFLLKMAKRFDLGFSWFNRHFDIEKKPLQSIGLVSGGLVACAYWIVVGILHLAHH